MKKVGEDKSANFEFESGPTNKCISKLIPQLKKQNFVLNGETTEERDMKPRSGEANEGFELEVKADATHVSIVEVNFCSIRYLETITVFGHGGGAC